MNKGTVYALWDYEAQNSDELSFHEGDAITILRRKDENETEWWWARLGDREGYVPKNLLGVSTQHTQRLDTGSQLALDLYKSQRHSDGFSSADIRIEQNTNSLSPSSLLSIRASPLVPRVWLSPWESMWMLETIKVTSLSFAHGKCFQVLSHPTSSSVIWSSSEPGIVAHAVILVFGCF